MKQELLVVVLLFVIVIGIASCSVAQSKNECLRKDSQYVSTGQLQGFCVDKDGRIIP